VVMNEQRTASDISNQRLDEMRERQRQQQPQENKLLPILPPVVLPEQPASPGP
jgi:hypothetical protein